MTSPDNEYEVTINVMEVLTPEEARAGKVASLTQISVGVFDDKDDAIERVKEMSEHHYNAYGFGFGWPDE